MRLGDCKIVHVAEDRQGLGVLDIWFENDLEQHGEIPAIRTMLVAGTGTMFPEDYEHVGTVVMQSGFIWHILRKEKPQQTVPLV